MMIREFKILATGQILDGYYLTDGSGDIQCLANKGHEIFYEWEFKKHINYAASELGLQIQK